jgi:hypothetical protein
MPNIDDWRVMYEGQEQDLAKLRAQAAGLREQLRKVEEFCGKHEVTVLCRVPSDFPSIAEWKAEALEEAIRAWQTVDRVIFNHSFHRFAELEAARLRGGERMTRTVEMARAMTKCDGCGWLSPTNEMISCKHCDDGTLIGPCCQGESENACADHDYLETKIDE